MSKCYTVYVKEIPVTLNLPEASNFDFFLIFSRLRDIEMLQFAIVKAKFDKILIVLMKSKNESLKKSCLGQQKHLEQE